MTYLPTGEGGHPEHPPEGPRHFPEKGHQPRHRGPGARGAREPRREGTSALGRGLSRWPGQ
eukprot:6748601-Lingulodinium_polyedra.AAC.1